MQQRGFDLSKYTSVEEQLKHEAMMAQTVTTNAPAPHTDDEKKLASYITLGVFKYALTSLIHKNASEDELAAFFKRDMDDTEARLVKLHREIVAKAVAAATQPKTDTPPAALN